jgi:23S rRNA (adenine2030-N6)-methyltransferase
LRGDVRAKAIPLDGWTALTAYVPPKERRGVVIIDPPFEEPDEFARLARGLAAAHRKWATGIYLLWYPVKDAADVAAFVRRIVRLRIARTLRAELIVSPATETLRLRGSGLILVNPPWTLYQELKILLPALAAVLAPDRRGATALDWLTDETSR